MASPKWALQNNDYLPIPFYFAKKIVEIMFTCHKLFLTISALINKMPYKGEQKLQNWPLAKWKNDGQKVSL